MSPEHYTKLTVEASIFCKTCMKTTRWRVADGRRQYCIPCYERDHAAAAEPPAKVKEGEPQIDFDFDWGGDR